jgi:hypothetical protein
LEQTGRIAIDIAFIAIQAAKITAVIKIIKPIIKNN